MFRIPSVSANSDHQEDMRRCPEMVKQRLLEAGADEAELCSTEGHPGVYGEKIVEPSEPTLLVYGHYHVKPPDPLNLWKRGPFDPAIKDRRIYARGSGD